ncbi:MAG: nickel transporter [Rhodopseudomonas sp.]|nr:nickel transporter [Rhodopseudomonas sp.]
MTWLARRSPLMQCILLIVLILLVAGAIDAATAGPFGVGGGGVSGSADIGGFTGWVLYQQAQFYRMLSGAIRAAKADGSAAWTLLGISFAYGIFHAAGPGHGKAVISSYLVANDETWKRGLVLSFAAAVMQAVTAVVIVAIAAVMLNATSKAMGMTVRVVEMVGYGLIILIGLRLLWVKGRALLKMLRPPADDASHHDHAHHHAHDHSHGHDHAHDHHHAHADAGAHDHTPHDHDHDDEGHAWGHAHAPEPAELTGRHWLRRGLGAVVAVGLRPCSGAIIVLVFALAQGLFWIGVASTFVMGLGTAITVSAIATLAVAARGLAGRLAKATPGKGLLLLRGLETAAAAVIVVFGVLLLTGYMVSERMIGV